MAYATNPRLPKVRMEAVRLVKYRGWSTRKVARHTGFSQSAIVKWCQKDPTGGWRYIPTQSSRPHSHPKQLSNAVVRRILELRGERRQCAEILHYRLQKEQGIRVSLSSVKRVLKRHGCSRYSQWKKWHQYPPRPLPEKPGVLVQIDTVLDGPPQDRLCAYALLDVCSRWAYAAPSVRTTTHDSLRVVLQAKSRAPFPITTLQTDHGSEFSKWFTKQLDSKGISHRHSRVRRPTDNGHVERFIRTLQEECLNRISRNFTVWQRKIPEYIHYYNTQRPHMGLNMKTPQEVITSY